MRRASIATVALLVLSAAVASVSGQFAFASLGDWGCIPIGGYHAQDELTVAAQFTTALQQINAQFILNPGDNFYYCGVHNKTDAMWQSTFENVFTDPSTNVPWYSALGNHDYGYPGSADAQLQYKSPNNNRWKMPGRYYYERLEFPGQVNISLIVLDASPCQKMYVSDDPSGWDPCGSVIPGCPGCTFHQNVVAQSCTQQLAWLQQAVQQVPSNDWKIAMIHAPASDIDVADLITPLQQANFDLVVNGHVHLLAHYTVDNLGTYITSGAGCMVKIEEREKNLKHLPNLGASSCTEYSTFHTCQIVYQKTIAGYATHVFDKDFTTLTTQLIDYQGNVLHTVATKKGGGNAPQPPAPSPTGNGLCCHYSDSSCQVGTVCCNDEGKSYDKYSCEGQYGAAHNCIWDWRSEKCIVGSSNQKK